MNFKTEIESKRKSAQNVGGQTNETAEYIADTLKQNRCLNIENNQVKKDIQVLLGSYDGFKIEAAKTQEELQKQIEQMNDDFEE
jgi:menaquinone-dependent protoporphyrinogen IX oxidase